MYLGDFRVNSIVRGFFNTRKADGTPINGSSLSAAVYKDGGTTESTAGVTLTVPFDARTGLAMFVVDTTADANFYEPHADYRVVLTAGTVDSVSVVGIVLGEFSIENRYALASKVWVNNGGTWV